MRVSERVLFDHSFTLSGACVAGAFTLFSSTFFACVCLFVTILRLSSSLIGYNVIIIVRTPGASTYKVAPRLRRSFTMTVTFRIDNK